MFTKPTFFAIPTASTLRFLGIVALLLVPSPTVASARAQEELASDRYLAYLEVLKDAKSFDEILPYWGSWMEAGSKDRSKKEKREKLESLQEEARARINVSFTGAEGDAGSTTLHLSAREKVVEDGEELELYLSGKVVMVREAGQWRIDEEAWWSE